MSHEALYTIFKEMFPHIEVWKYKKIDSHSIEVTSPKYYLIFTYYGESSWQLATK